MLTLDEIESGLYVTHQADDPGGAEFVEAEDDEVLLSPEQEGLQDLTVPLDLFRSEFVATDRFRAAGGRRGGRGRRRTPQAGTGPVPVPTGPKSKGKIKKMVRDRGFGFIRGGDGKEACGRAIEAEHGQDEGKCPEQAGARVERCEEIPAQDVLPRRRAVAHRAAPAMPAIMPIPAMTSLKRSRASASARASSRGLVWRATAASTRASTASTRPAKRRSGSASSATSTVWPGRTRAA